MINLLPPQIKSEIAYSKFNTTLIKLIAGMVIAGATLIAIVRIGSANTDVSIAAVNRQLGQNKTESRIEKTLRATSERFNTVSSINANRPRYSGFIRALAGALPGDAVISGLELRADAAPLKLSVSTASSSSAGKLKDAISKLSQVQSAEVEGVTQSTTGFDVVASVILKPGAFR